MSNNLLIHIIAGTVAGLLAGIFPLVAASKKNILGVGIGAMLACGFCGAVLGLILAIPAAILLTYLINKQNNLRM